MSASAAKLGPRTLCWPTGVVMFVGSAAVLVVSVLGMMLGAPGADGAVYVVGAAVGLLLGALVVVGVW